MSEICGVDGCASTTHTSKSHRAMDWMRSNKSAQRAIAERARAKKLAELRADLNDPRHGRSGSYVAGCRCESCTAAHSAYSRQHRQQRPFGVFRASAPGATESMVGKTFNNRADAEAYVDAHSGDGKFYRVYDRAAPVELQAGKRPPRRRRLSSATSKEERHKSLASNANDPMHGTHSGYVYGCRCDRCTQASRDYGRARRASLPFRVARVAVDGVTERLMAATFATRGAAERWVSERPNTRYRIIDTRRLGGSAA